MTFREGPISVGMESASGVWGYPKRIMYTICIPAPFRQPRHARPGRRWDSHLLMDTQRRTLARGNLEMTGGYLAAAPSHYQPGLSARFPAKDTSAHWRAGNLHHTYQSTAGHLSRNGQEGFREEILKFTKRHSQDWLDLSPRSDVRPCHIFLASD